jgi:hypothetical protein
MRKPALLSSPRLTPPAFLTALGSSLQGLAGTEAAARRAIDGPNSLPPARGRSAARELVDQLTQDWPIRQFGATNAPGTHFHEEA